MKASEVRKAVAARVSAAVITKANGRDRLNWVDVGMREADALPERSFTLTLLGPPQRLDYFQCVAYMVEFEAEVHYASAPGVEDRLGDDAQAITNSIYNLHTENPDIWSGEARAQSPVELDGAITAPLSIIVRYRG